MIDGEIIHIEKFFDEAQCVEYWQISARCMKRPALQAGQCKIEQTEEMLKVNPNAKVF